MRRIPRLGTWWVGILLLLLTLWWLCYVPFSGVRLLAAVPYNAQFLSAHHDLAGRWSGIAANPATRSLLSSLGVEPDRLDELTMDAGFQKILGRVKPREVVVAYVPELGRRREPAWVGAAWIGARSHALRWLGPLLDMPGVERTKIWGNRIMWTVPVPSQGADSKLFLVLEEGIVLACLAAGADSMASVLHCFDGHAMSVAAMHGDGPAVTWPLRSDVQDRGWVEMSAWGKEGGPTERWLFELNELTNCRLEGRIRVPGNRATTSRLVRQDEEREIMGRCLGSIPQGAVLVPWNRLLGLLNRWPGPWLDGLQGIASDLDIDHVGLFLLGDEYSGRVRGVKVPTVLLATSVSDTSQVLEKVSGYLDQLNGDYQVGLFPAEEPVGDRRLFGVATSLNNTYADLADDERIAYAVLDDMVLVSSSEGPLRALVGRYDWQLAEEEKGSAAWNVADIGAGTLWFDLVDGLETMRKGMFAYTVALMAQGTADSQAKFETLRAAKAWLQTLAPLQELHISTREHEDGGLDITIRSGEP